MRRLPSLLVNLVLTVLALGASGLSAMLVRDTGTGTAATVSRTVTVAQGLVTATVTADGTLAAGTTASASFKTSGTVTAVSVTVGQKVTKGQVLAKVDPADAGRGLALADANLVAADGALHQAEVAGADTTVAHSAVTTARLAVIDAQAAVAGTVLTAPMAGTVVAVNGTLGSTASASSSGPGASTSSGTSTSSSGSASFVDLADLADLQVTADFAEGDATKVTAGQVATIAWSALPGATATGKVLSVDPSATTTSNDMVTYGVTTSIDKLPAGARPGQSVSVSVVTGTATDAVYVNAAAVTVAGNRYTVEVRFDDGTTATRTVEVGLAGDDAYQITSGLAVGEKVVLSPSTSGSTTDSRQTGQGGGNPGGAGGARDGTGGPP